MNNIFSLLFRKIFLLDLVKIKNKKLKIMTNIELNAMMKDLDKIYGELKEDQECKIINLYLIYIIYEKNKQ